MALTKEVLAEALQDGTAISRKAAADTVETILRLIKTALAAGEDVLISRFGKFEVKSKRARKGRNPATGGNMLLEARKVVTFKPSRLLREKVNRPDKGAHRSLL